ncbi:MAG: hypothetical protein H6757_00075 [Candidatus Omnitrophica bacterium]|nr:hypothetical protein [Candidatus Omnitrophota bacterium]
MMNPKDIERLNKILKLVKQLQQLKDLKKTLDCLKESKELFRNMSSEELEIVREQTDYDEVEWARLLHQLLEDDGNQGRKSR